MLISKRLAFLLLTGALFVFISVGSVLAASTPKGGSQDIFTVQSNYSNSTRVINRANMRQIVRRPESALDLTCFGDQMANLALLGNMFSDLKFDLGGFNFSGDFFCNLLAAGLDIYGPSLDTSLGGLLGSNINFGVQPIAYCLPPVSLGFELLDSLGFSIAIPFSFMGVSCPISLGSTINLNAGISVDFAGLCLNLVPTELQCQSIDAMWSGGQNYSVQGQGTNLGADYMFGKDLANMANTIDPNNYFNVQSPMLGGGPNGLMSKGSFQPGPGSAHDVGTSDEFKHEIGINNDILQNLAADNAVMSGPGILDSWTASPSNLDNANTADEVILQMEQ